MGQGAKEQRAVVQRTAGQPTWMVGQAHRRAYALLDGAFADAGSRPRHYRLLAALDGGGPMSQAQAGRITGIDRSDVTAGLDVLCQQGFARREPDPADRRRNVISITARGRSELGVLDEVLAQVQTQFLAPLTERERRQFHALLTKLIGDDPGAGE